MSVKTMSHPIKFLIAALPALIVPLAGSAVVAVTLTTVGVSSAEADVRYRFPRTRAGGLLAWCQPVGCGFAAAHRYCQRRGHPGARRIRPWRVRNCSGRRCVAFRFIQCIGSRQGGFSGGPQGFRRTFYAPRFNGAVVDHCLWWTASCGSPAAHSFCRRVGFRRAVSYSRFRPGRTWVLASRRFCVGSGCVGFRQITCVR